MDLYGLYKVIEGGAGRIVTSHSNVDTLREAANFYYAKPENFVGRFQRQLIIPKDKVISNRVYSDGGGQVVGIYIEIHAIDLPGIK